MSAKQFVYVWLLVLLSAEPALAHSPIKGIGSFYNGLLHPILVPAHLLLLVSAGLLFGQRGSQKIELILGSFALATLTGLTAAWFSIFSEMETSILVLAATIGLLIAVNPQIRLQWYIVIALLTGFFLGIDSAQEELFGKDKLASLFGSGVAIYFLSLYPMALANYFNKKSWQKIGIRILGSWVTASSLLVLALALSKTT
jgi:urease accessory protein